MPASKTPPVSLTPVSAYRSLFQCSDKDEEYEEGNMDMRRVSGKGHVCHCGYVCGHVHGHAGKGNNKGKLKYLGKC